MKTLIKPTTAAVTKSIHIPADQFVSVAQTSLAGAEEITFRISLGGTYTEILPKVALTANLNYLQIAGPNSYEIVKPTTASPVGVYVTL